MAIVSTPAPTAKKTRKSYRAVHYNDVIISLGNSKLGAVANISLPPITACVGGVPCAEDCYALKAFRNYPSARNAWLQNWHILQTDPAAFWDAVYRFLADRSPVFFRWWVAGDTPDQEALDQQKELAREFPKTRFLLFTKNHGLDFRWTPENFTIILSMWPGFGDTRKKLPRAWMDDGTDPRIPADAFQCGGSCENCQVCWHIRTIGVDVCFPKH